MKTLDRKGGALSQLQESVGNKGKQEQILSDEVREHEKERDIIEVSEMDRETLKRSFGTERE